MANQRQLELHLLRFLPHPLRDDFVTVGFLLLESDGGFAEVRVTRDLRTLRCLAPDADPEWFEMVENEIRKILQNVPRRDELVELVNDRFGTMLDVAPTKAVVTGDPAQEMEVLASIYLAPAGHGPPAAQPTRRSAIVNRMKEAFEGAGVLGLMQRDLQLAKYTGAGDPLRIDFGYRVGSTVKMFHAVPVAANVDQALALALRYSRVEAGMQQERLQASLTAVVEQEKEMWDSRTLFAVEMLQQNSVRVRKVGEMAELAGEVRRELLG
jgi:chorismate mutase